MGRRSEGRPVRERIVDAAIGVLGRQGVKKLGQPRVAREAGIPQGHLTYYFPKKADLLAAVAERFAEMLGRELAGGGGRGPRSVVRFAGRLAKDRVRTRMLLGLLVEVDAQDSPLRSTMARNAALVRRVLAQALGRAESDPDVDVALATLWGIGIQHLVFRRDDATTDAVLARFEQWLASPPPAAAAEGDDG